MSEHQTPYDDIAVTAVNVAMLMSYSGIRLFPEIAQTSQELWSKAGHETQPALIDPQVHAPGIEVRYRLASRLLHGAPQILDIACGLTPRGITMTSENPDLTYVEFDLPLMIALKRRILSRLALKQEVERIPQNLHLEAGSVTDAPSVQRAARHFNRSQGVAVSTEGLLHYMTHKEKATIAKNIGLVLSRHPNGVWYTDMPTWEGISGSDSKMAATTSAQAKRSVPHNRFQTRAEAKAFFGALGLDVRELHSYVESSLVDSLTSLEAVGANREEFIATNQPWSLWELHVAD